MLSHIVPCHFHVCNQHFAGCTGYGHDEAGGREALDQAFAEIMGAESAIVRSQVCHQLCVCVCFFFLDIHTLCVFVYFVEVFAILC